MFYFAIYTKIIFYIHFVFRRVDTRPRIYYNRIAKPVKEETVMTVLEKMKKVMQDKGISEQDLAAAIGVSKGAMHNWMKGVGKPSANAEAKFEKYCTDNGVSFE